MFTTSKKLKVPKSLVIVAVVLALLYVVPNILAWGTSENYIKEPKKLLRENAKSLVVIVPTMAGTADGMNDVFEVVKNEDKYIDADIVVIQFAGGPFSNADPKSIADEIESTINRLYSEKRYENIVLIGASAGALLVRKAFVWALGSQSDRSTPSPVRVWPSAVERIVLLAGMNRGWTISPKPEHMGFFTKWIIKAGIWVGKFSGTGSFIFDLEKGSPFVADLRIQWISESIKKNPRIKPVVQLLGSIDDIVSKEDNKDVLVSSNFTFIPVGANTTHERIVRVGEDTTNQRIRRSLFREAISHDISLLQKKYKTQVPPTESHPAIKKVVFVAHGIRDFGSYWMSNFEQEINKFNGDSELLYAYKRVAYENEFFPMGAFLLLNQRENHVKRFMDQYTEAKAQYPEAKFSFIGHSNGTYILGSALQKYKTIEIERAVLMGSVLPQKYEWLELPEERIGEMRNLVGSSDWVVAIFPRLYEFFRELFGIELKDANYLNIGAAGFRGFNQDGIVDVVHKGEKCGTDNDNQLGKKRFANLKWLDGQHSVGIDVTHPSKFKSIVAYLLDENVNEIRFAEVQYCTDKADGAIDFLSKISWFVWIVLILFVLGIGWSIVIVFKKKTEIRPIFVIPIYAVFIVLVLFSI